MLSRTRTSSDQKPRPTIATSRRSPRSPEGVETAAPEHRDVEEDGMVAMKGHSVVARAAVARVEDLVLQLGVVADRAALEVVA